MKRHIKLAQSMIMTLARFAMVAVLVLGIPLTALAQGPGRAPRASQSLLNRAKNNPHERVRVIVQKRGNGNGLAQAAQSAGAEMGQQLDLINAVVMEVPVNAINGLAKNPNVQWISLDAPLVATADPLLTVVNPIVTDGIVAVPVISLDNSFLYTTQVSALQANEPSLTGQGVGVAVIDSGINEVADLSGRVVVAINSHGESADASDEFCHGTHVAGIIAADGTSSGGLYRGVAPGTDLINVKVSGDHGMGYASDLIGGLQWVYENKDAYNIKVANLSLNSTVAESYLTDPLCAAVEMLWFRGITVVVSAGNNGNANGPVTLYPPANDPFVITVGSVDTGKSVLDLQALRADTSAYGTTFEGYSKPDLVAPGVDIVSLLASPECTGYLEHPAHRIGGAYEFTHFRMSGTSMASPIVAGIAALVHQYDESLDPNQVKYRLKDAATVLEEAGTGAGLVAANDAIQSSTTDAANSGVQPNMLIREWLFVAIEDSVNWDSVNWDSVNWDSVNWDSVNWDSVNWDSVNWDSVNWDSVNWDSVNWDSVNWDSVNWDSVNWDD